jgi:amino acid adenylation domain-containing protein
VTSVAGSIVGPSEERLPDWHLGERVARAAERFGRRPFLRDDSRGLSVDYGTAAEAIGRLAGALRHAGVDAGDRVLIVAENRIEVALLVFAVARAGALVCVLTDEITRQNLEEVIRQTTPRLLIASAGAPPSSHPRCVPLDAFLQAADGREPGGPADVPRRRNGVARSATPHDPVALIYTSGSTGAPKGIVLSHDNIWFTAQAIHQRLRYREDDLIGLFLPLSFDYGLYQLFLATLCGAGVLVGHGGQIGPDFIQMLRRDVVTVLPVVPTLLARILALVGRRPQPVTSLRAITSTGEHLPDAYVRRCRELLPDVALYPMYGLTECKRVSVLRPSELAAKPGSVGRPLDGVRVTVINAEGTILPSGRVGELVVSGRNVTWGYWGDAEGTAARFSDDPVSRARSLRTGDFGWVDEDGFLFITGRSDGLTKHRGRRISLAEVEAAALGLTGVQEAAVVRLEARDELHLFIAPAMSDARVRALRTLLEQRLESFKVPERIRAVAALPRMPTGKLDRAALARWANEGATA